MATSSKRTQKRKAPARASKGTWQRFKRMSPVFLVAFVFGSFGMYLMSQSSAANPIPPIGSANAPASYGLAWSDEFDGTSVDKTKWNIFENANYGAGNKEDMCYYGRNIDISNGTLKFTAKKETVKCGGTNPDTGNATYYWTSGALTTRAMSGEPQKFAFTKGYAETRIKFPKGNAYWGGFWLVGGVGAPGWPDYGEIDVVEQLGSYPDAVIQTFHYKCGTGSCSTGANKVIDISNFDSGWRQGTKLTSSNFSTFDGVTTSRFVRYGILWEDNKLTWYVDGRPTRSFDGQNIFTYTTDISGNVLSTTLAKTVTPVPNWTAVLNYSHAMILNQSVGGGLPASDGYTGNETATGYDDGNLVAVQPGIMEVDYVRYYKAGSASTPAPAPAPTPSDTTKPTVSITAPTANQVVKGVVNVTVNASDNVKVSSVKLSVNGTVIETDTTSPYTFALDTTRYNDGAYSITAQAVDTSDNVTITSATPITIKNGTTVVDPPAPTPTPSDTTKPVVSISAPANGSTAQGKVTVKVAAKDNVAIKRTSLYIDGNWYKSDTSAPFEFVVDTTSLKNNSKHSFYVSATDASDNRAESTVSSYTVKNSWWRWWWRW